jgi:hypothetical protein
MRKGHDEEVQARDVCRALAESVATIDRCGIMYGRECLLIYYLGNSRPLHLCQFKNTPSWGHKTQGGSGRAYAGSKTVAPKSALLLLLS